MAKLKIYFMTVAITCASVIIRSSQASSPSIELLFGPRANQTTTPSPISQRIQASLNNVLRIPIPLFGAPTAGSTTGGSSQQQATPEQLNIHLRQQVGTNGGQRPRPPFLPNVNQAIHTIAQLSTLTHWPFGYVTTTRPQTQAPEKYFQTSTFAAPTPAPTTTTPATVQPPTTAPPTPPPPPPPQPSTNSPIPPPPLPPLILPPQSESIFQAPIMQQPKPTPRPSLPERIHNRIHSSILGNYIRLPNLSHIGQPRPLPMITEPPWVTELLGPTLEPPTTRVPTLGERVHNAVNNVLLFVPATLLNFWYQNWGTQHVDRIIQQLQIVTPKPGAPGEQMFAIISNPGNNSFSNFSVGQFEFGGLNTTDLPTIAAFINANGTLMPTIVHPVVNMTSNTIEYQLRGENETTILWTGSLSNDIFFGNKKPVEEESFVVDAEENQRIKNSVLNVKLK